MLGTLTCWVLALAMIFSDHTSVFGLQEKLLYAMGFIFLAVINNAVNVYYETHIDKNEKDSKS